MTRQLVQARRIANLREQRSERERREAAQRLRQQSADAEAAQAHLHRHAAQRAEAERLLIIDPADPQAQLWRMLSREREQAATHLADEAENSLVNAQGRARAAQSAHDRNIQRGLLLDQRITAGSALTIRIADERDADEVQGRVR